MALYLYLKLLQFTKIKLNVCRCTRSWRGIGRHVALKMFYTRGGLCSSYSFPISLALSKPFIFFYSYCQYIDGLHQLDSG